MTRRLGMIGLLLSSVCIGPSGAGTQTAPAEGKEKARVPRQARGSFEVKVTPAEAQKDTLASGRFTLEKTLQGDLAGTSKGEMWTTETGVEGSAGYVAIEKFDATLHGRRGTFTLLHQATMRKGGEFRMSLGVVPDSGTGALAGLEGKMTIIIADGKHSYEFDYTLPEAP